MDPLDSSSDSDSTGFVHVGSEISSLSSVSPVRNVRPNIRREKSHTGVVVATNVVESVTHGYPFKMMFVGDLGLGTVIKILAWDYNLIKEYEVLKEFPQQKTILGIVELNNSTNDSRATVVGAGLDKPQVVKCRQGFARHSLVMANFVNLPFDFRATFENDEVILTRTGEGRVDARNINQSEHIRIMSIEIIPPEHSEAIRTNCREFDEITFEEAKLFIHDPYVAITEMEEYEAIKYDLSHKIKDIQVEFLEQQRMKFSLTPANSRSLFNGKHSKRMRMGATLCLCVEDYFSFAMDAVIMEYRVNPDGTREIVLKAARHSSQVFKFYVKLMIDEPERRFTVSHGYVPSNTSAAIQFGFFDFFNGKHFDSWSGRLMNESQQLQGEINNVLNGNALDASQTDALYTAARSPGFTVISAPPGSGKTMVIGALCRAKWDINAAEEKGILIGSSMNIATTEAVFKVKDTTSLRVCRKFSPKLKVILTDQEKSVSVSDMALHDDYDMYIGELGRKVKEEIENIKEQLDHVHTSAHRHGQLLIQLRDLLADLERLFFEGYNPHVVGTTLYYITAKKVPRDVTHLILDESSRISVAEALAIYCSYPDLESITILGDSHQLPPFQSLNFHGLAKDIAYVSEMTRMETLRTVNVCNLNFLYRGHPLITDMILKPIYGPQIQSGITEDNRVLAQQHRLPTSNDGTPCLFVQIGSQEGREKRINKNEMNAVINFLEFLKRRGVDMDGVLIVVHHLDQKERMIRKMKNRGTYGPLNLIANIVSADSCQGIEAAIVIVMTTKTCADANKAGSVLSFISEPHRETVAISRAREAMYIFGDWRQLSAMNFWSKLVVNANASEAWIDADNLV